MKRILGQENDANLIDPGSVTTKYLAEVLGMTPVAVSKLASQKVVKNNGRRGKYNIIDAVPAYIASIRGSGKAEADARLKVQQTRKLQLANDEHAGKLVKIADAAEVYRQALLAWRAGINALPRRLATKLANQDDSAKIQKALMNEFSELYYSMAKPLQRYFDSAGVPFVVISAGNNGSQPAAKKNARPMGRRKKNTATRKRRAGKVAKR